MLWYILDVVIFSRPVFSSLEDLLQDRILGLIPQVLIPQSWVLRPCASAGPEPVCSGPRRGQPRGAVCVSGKRSAPKILSV